MDKIALMKHMLKIVNKQGIVVPFDLDNYRAAAHFQRNKGNRNLVCKHRQGAMSSGILGDMFTDCIIHPHIQCAVISHETRSTQRLLDRIQFFHDSMEDPKPQLDASSRSEKRIAELGSSIYIGTAGSRAFGRGDTIHKALLSELAFYEDARTILNAVEDSVPLTGELTVECTPNGEDNVFYEEWVKAREGKSPFKAFFYPWWWTRDYQIPKGSNLAMPEDKGDLVYSSEEEELVAKFKVTEAQIRWRRWMIALKGGLFWQEYPEDELTCFITVGDPVFDTFVLTTLGNSCYEGERHEGGWSYWIPPLEGIRYVIGADSAAGAPGGSYSAAVVLDDLWRVCATFQARVEPHTFANLLKQMGKCYNNAQIAVERNFTGYAVLGQMGDYGNLYHQRDFLTGKVTSNIGWWTNSQTKEMMQTRLKEKLAALRMHDINLVRQLRGYRYIRHKPTAQTFDDLAIALMIAVAVRSVEGTARGFMGATAGWSW